MEDGARCANTQNMVKSEQSPDLSARPLVVIWRSRPVVKSAYREIERHFDARPSRSTPWFRPSGVTPSSPADVIEYELFCSRFQRDSRIYLRATQRFTPTSSKTTLCVHNPDGALHTSIGKKTCSSNSNLAFSPLSISFNSSISSPILSPREAT